MEPLSIAAVVLIVLSFVPPVILLGVIVYQTFSGRAASWRNAVNVMDRSSGSVSVAGNWMPTQRRQFMENEDSAFGQAPRQREHTRQTSRLRHREAIRQMASAASGSHPGAAGPNTYSTFIRPVQHLGWRSTHISRGFSRIPLLVYDRFGNCHTEHRLLCMN